MIKMFHDPILKIVVLIVIFPFPGNLNSPCGLNKLRVCRTAVK